MFVFENQSFYLAMSAPNKNMYMDNLFNASLVFLKNDTPI